MLIFCQNAKLAPTYCEILEAFKPTLITEESELLRNLSPTQVLIIDENTELASTIVTKNESPAVLLIGHENPNSEEFAFLQKPITANGLIQKVKLLANRQEQGLLVNFTLGNFTFCGQKRTMNGIPLTQKEAEIIQLLYENRNKILSKEEILQDLFGYAQDAQTHTLETHIYKLRQKIGDNDAKFILTQDKGYAIMDETAHK